MSARPWLLLGAALTCCGTAELPVDIDVEPGDAVAFAVLGEGGKLEEAGLLLADASGQPLTRQVKASEWLLVWRLGPEDLIDVEGAPLAAELRAGLAIGSAELESTGLGACGRCLVPALVGAAGQVILAGASCTLPATAEASAFRIEGSSVIPSSGLDVEALLESVRTRLRVEAPGECPCSMSPPSLEGIELDTRLPEEAPQALSALAAVGDVIYGAAPGTVFRRDLSTGREDWWPDDRAPPVAEFGVTLLGGDYLVSYFDSSLTTRRFNLLRRYSPQPDGTLRASDFDLGVAVRITGMYRAPADPARRLFIYGDVVALATTQGWLGVCDGDGNDCTEVGIGCGGSVTAIYDVSVTDQGRIYVSSTGLLSVLEPGADEWSCYPLPSTLASNGVRFTLLAVEERGDRVFGCGSTGLEIAIFSWPIAQLDQLSTLDRSELTIAAGQYCNGTISDLTPQDPMLIAVGNYFGSDHLFAFDATGALLSDTLASDRFGPTAVEIREIGGRLVVRDAGNRIATIGTGGSLEPVYGPLSDRLLPNYQLGFALADGAALLVGDPLAALVVGVDRTEDYTSADPGTRIMSKLLGAYDTGASTARSKPTFISNHVAADGTPRFIRTTLEPDRSLTTEVLPWYADGAIALAESVPGRFVLVNRGGIWLQSPDRKEPIAQIAGSNLIESAGLLGFQTRPQPSSSAGVVWLPISHGLLRIAGGIAEPFAIENAVSDKPPSLLCPDEVVTIQRNSGLNKLVHIGPSPEGPSTALLAPAELDTEHPSKAAIDFWTLRDGAGFAWIELPTGTFVQQGQRRPFGLGFRPSAVVQTPTQLVFGGNGGRVAIARRR